MLVIEPLVNADHPLTSTDNVQHFGANGEEIALFVVFDDRFVVLDDS
jgi:hypothetical protein